MQQRGVGFLRSRVAVLKLCRGFASTKPAHPYTPPPYPIKDADGFDVTFVYPTNFQAMKPEDVKKNAEWQIKKKAAYTKRKPGREYDKESTYKITKLSEIISSSTFILCFQHNMATSEMNAFKSSVENATEYRCKVKPVLKNSFCRIALERVNGGKYKGLQNLFRGPTSIIYGTTSSFALEDIKMLLGKEQNLFYLGGLVNEAVIDHVQLKTLATVTSELDLRSSLIDLLLQPSRNLVRAIQSPLNNLVKVLAFNPATTLPAPEAAGETTGQESKEAPSV